MPGEPDQPLALKTPIIWAVSGMHPCLQAQLLFWSADRQGLTWRRCGKKGWGWAGAGWVPALSVVKRYGSGRGKSLYLESTQRKVGCCWGRWKIQKRWGRHSFSPFSLFFCHFAQLEDTLASFSRSLSFCWQESQIHTHTDNVPFNLPCPHRKVWQNISNQHYYKHYRHPGGDKQ